MGSSNTPSSAVVEKVGHKVDGDLDKLKEGGEGDAEAEGEDSAQCTPEAPIALLIKI